MRAAVSENGFAVNCRFNGFLFTLETVYHREQELMTESYDPQTGMLKVEVESNLFDPPLTLSEYICIRSGRAPNADPSEIGDDPFPNVLDRNVSLQTLPKMDRKSLLFLPNRPASFGLVGLLRFET